MVLEDSNIGLRSAKAAGRRVVVTTNLYTENEDLCDADLIATGLGHADGVRGKLTKGGAGLTYDGVLRVHQVVRYFGG